MNKDHIRFIQDKKPVQLHNDEILFIKAARDYVRLITPNKGYIMHSTMKGVESRVNTSVLVRVHRCFIINIRKATIVNERGVLIGGNIIPVSKTYVAGLLQRMAG